MPIDSLIHNPLFWLDIISNYRVTHAQIPNFILAQITEKLKTNIKGKGNWNLSSVQKIGVGAETIVAKTARSFIEILSIYNLHPNALCPVYGMTECGPIAGSSDGLSLTTTSSGNLFVQIGKPAAGHSIRIVAQNGCILEENQIGRIQVIGSSMTSGYYKAPEQNCDLFTEDGWMNTGDLGFLQEGRLTVTGREKEIVIINARNYSCHEIELVAEEVEGVEPYYTVACAIRKLNSNTDELVIFFHTLALEDGYLAQLLKQIRSNISHKLGINPTYLIPIEKSVIPRTLTGKIQRLQLKQRFEAGEFDDIWQQVEVLINQERKSNFVAPRDELELQLAKIWEQVFDMQPIGIHDNFFELGGHSLLAVRLFAEIEKTFDQNLPLATLFQAPTVEQLANIISQSGWSKPWSSLMPIQLSGSNPPLFCIHALGGNVLGFTDLARCLGAEQPVYGLQAQGLDGKQAPYTRIEDMASHYIKEIRTIQFDGPYFLAGHSFGGIVAIEMAQQLVTQGQKVALVALFDTKGPDFCPLPQRLPFRVRLSSHLDNFLHLGVQEKLTYLLDYIVGRWQWKSEKLKKQIDYLIKKITCKFYSAIEHPLPYTLRKFSVTQSHKQAVHSYVRPIYRGQAILFRCTEQAMGRYHDLGWGKLVRGGLEIYNVPGDHGSMLKEPHVQVLAEKLRACLAKVQSKGLPQNNR